MTTTLYVVLSLWTLVSGQTNHNHSDVRPCCVPSHFWCEMDVTGGYTDQSSRTPIFVDRKVRLYNDYDRNITREDADVTLPGGNKLVHSELTFYDKHISYKIDGDRCHVDNITNAMQDRCIPDDATLVSKGRVGHPPHDFMTHTWRWGSGIVTLRTVTAEKCLPVYQSVYTVYNGGYSDMAYSISNIEVGEVPASIIVPNFCRP